MIGETIGQAGQRGSSLRSIQYPDARLSVLYLQGNLEVIAVEIGSGACLREPSLWAGASWHLVVEGQPIFQQGDQTWELLPEDALCLRDCTPYTIVNPAPRRVKLLTLLFKKHKPDRRKGGRRR